MYSENDNFCASIRISKMHFRKFTPLEKWSKFYTKIFFRFFLSGAMSSCDAFYIQLARGFGLVTCRFYYILQRLIPHAPALLFSWFHVLMFSFLRVFFVLVQESQSQCITCRDDLIILFFDGLANHGFINCFKISHIFHLH